MTIEELKDWQDRNLAEFRTKAASSNPATRNAAVEEARNRLIAAGIIDDQGRLTSPYC